MIEGLEESCMNCGEVVGDHTVRQWNLCASAVQMDLKYEDVPEDVRAFTERLGFAHGVQVADHCIARSLVMKGDSAPGMPRVVLPVVQLEFSVGTPKGSLEGAKIAFIGSEESIGKFGKLVRDTSNGAVNAARRANG